MFTSAVGESCCAGDSGGVRFSPWLSIDSPEVDDSGVSSYDLGSSKTPEMYFAGLWGFVSLCMVTQYGARFQSGLYGSYFGHAMDTHTSLPAPRSRLDAPEDHLSSCLMEAVVRLWRSMLACVVPCSIQKIKAFGLQVRGRLLT